MKNGFSSIAYPFINRREKMKRLWFLASCAFFSIGSLHAEQVVIKSVDGQKTVLQLSGEETISDLKQQIEGAMGYPAEVQEIFYEGRTLADSATPVHHSFRTLWVMPKRGSSPKETLVSASLPRDYFRDPSEADKQNITFIITTLADKSLPRLLKSKGDLSRAGDKVEHVHPLRFLEYVFTDERLKIGIRNMKKRGSLIWKEFMGGLNRTMSEEKSHDNLKDEYIERFASRVGIDVGLIYPSLQRENWNDFVNQLIVHVPRQGGHDRYDN